MARCEAGLLGVVLLVLAASGCQKDEPGLDGAVNLVDAAVEPDSGPLGAPCTKDADCASGLCLEGGICSGRCTGATDCPPGWRCEERAGVGKVCVCDGGGAEVCNGKDDDCDTKVDNGAPCPIGQYCHEGQCRCIPPSELCNGACEDVTQSLLHCGKCDNACPTSGAPPNMEPACLEGNCGFACKQGFGDCDGDAESGCEQDLLADAQHCGSCSKVCKDFCAGGVCCDHPALIKSCTGGFCTVVAGCFMMGSPPDEPCRIPKMYDVCAPTLTDCEREHPVRLTRNFEIGQTEVTQAQFEQVMGYNPSKVSSTDPNCAPGASTGCPDPNCGLPGWPPCTGLIFYCGSTETCGDHPVEHVNWHEAAAYCNALSNKAGLKPCYACTGSARVVSCKEDVGYGQSGLYSCPGYRLPTEAEWEYAYRGGTTTAYYSGPNDPAACGVGQCEQDKNLDPIAWYCFNASFITHPVGLKQPNGWGLHDMPAGVGEWCNDWFAEYDTSASGKPLVDPGGPGTGYKGQRALRSGGGYPRHHRAARRFMGISVPGIAGSGGGVRCARTLQP